MKSLYSFWVGLCLCVFYSTIVYAQPPAHALKNITIHHADGRISESATIVWRNGIIEEVGTNVTIPFDAYTIDGGDSLHIYPGFIDGMTVWGSPDLPKNPQRPRDPGNPGYERGGIQPDREPSEVLKSDSKEFAAAMKAGFTTAALVPKGYMLPGQVELFMLSEKETVKGVYAELGLAGSFTRAARGAYPSTIMGVMARFRQLMYDAKALHEHMGYYEQNPNMPVPQSDEVLEDLFPLIEKEAPLFFLANTREDIEKMLILKDEFSYDVVVVSGKEAYTMAAELKARDIPVLASIELPDTPKFYAASKKKQAAKKKEDTPDSDEGDAEDDDSGKEEQSEEEKAYQEKQLKAWKEQVHNIKTLKEAGVRVGYASVDMKIKDLGKHVKTLMEEVGFTEADLIPFMTTDVAAILGVENKMGNLEKGKIASFTVFDKPFTEKKAKALHSISNGQIFDF
ncbi:MAG: amidohydrolase family protein [Bacteroidota bacterium]